MRKFLVSLTLLLSTSHLASAFPDDGSDVTERLNGFIGKGSNGVYTGGKGVIVRAPDFISGDDSKVVPASFWVNDITAPSQFYPTAGNIWYPNNGWDGYGDITWQYPQEPAGTEGPWSFACVGVVVGSAMEELYPDFYNIQTADWGWGVFYATDSNAVDKRCVWWEDHQGWDCPGGWLDTNGNFDTTSGSKGAGNYHMGNPSVVGLEAGGGGAGCHYGDGGAIDQPDSKDANNNLVGNSNCECNYGLNGNDWADWFWQFATNLQQKPGFESRNWLGGGGGYAPSWATDGSMCWVSNPRDLIMMQNQLHWNRQNWNNQQVPLANWGSGETYEMRKYWGWNEIPVDRNILEDPMKWDAIMIKLPADLCNDGNFGSGDSAWCLGAVQSQTLENDLDQFVSQNKLLLGMENIGNRPGSYVVFVREWGQTWGSSKEGDVGSSFSGVDWERYFFCENWQSPNGKYQIVHIKPSDDFGGNGACYIDWGSGPSPSPSPNAIVHSSSQKCLGVDGDVYNGNKIVVSACTGQTNQGWAFDSNAGTLFSMVNDGMCVDIPGGQMYAGNPLEIWECNGLPQQWFGFDSNLGSIYASGSSDASLCMDVLNGGADETDVVQLWDCQWGGGDNQRWNLMTSLRNDIFA